MFLEQVKELNGMPEYNNLSPKLRAELEKEIDSFGKEVRFKFKIGRPDPHPDNRGQTVYPKVYNLDPVTFLILDKDEEPGKTKSKRIGMVKTITTDAKEPHYFERIQVLDTQKAVLKLMLDDIEDRARCMYLLLHPKLSGGRFADTKRIAVVERIDEKKYAQEQRAIRSAKVKAQQHAEKMSDEEVATFISAMNMDAGAMDMEEMRNKVEEMAELTPEYFNDLIESKAFEYQAVVKKALDKQAIAFNPAEWKFIWPNQQNICILNEVPGKNEVELMAEWLMQGEKKHIEVYNKLKSLIK